MRGRDVGIVLQVVDIVEAVGGDQLARRERLTAFVAAELQEVRQRIDMRGRDVGIGCEILPQVEGQRRHPAFLPADLVEVVERIDARGLHVRIGREVDEVEKNALGSRPSCQPNAP